ncbi:MAG: hypothetical protein RLZZ505_2254 [Verrucomicrobiota bacterium]|jgi:hypothetical protein
MRNLTLTLLFAAGTILHAEELRQDLLSFSNGDQLHGRLSGISDGSSIQWKRDDVGGEVKFKSSELRRIILRGGRPAKSIEGFSHIGTSNGDRIPGVVREMDDKWLVLETKFGGIIEVPRNQVGLIAPNPLGGRVLYHGPHDPEEWLMIDHQHPEGIPALRVDEKTKMPLWRHSGSAWYWQNKETGTALVKKAGMPDRAVLRFDIAWKNRLSCAIAFHSDFKKAKPAVANEVENDVQAQERMIMAGRVMNSASLPDIFGDSYVLQLYSNYVMLHRTSFDADGRPRLDRVQTTNSSMRLGDSGTATVELRCNRPTGEISLFVNGEFVVQWSEVAAGENEAGGYAGKGDGFGFLVQSEDSPVRISEVVVAEWNGMPDAARSLQVDDADIVLLSNGTDRFSGKVTGLVQGKLKLEGRYGDFEFPLSEIAEVRFAKSRLAEAPIAPSAEIKTRLHPLGGISGRPLSGDAGNMRVMNGIIGEININLDYAVMLEFQQTESFLDDWDAEF